MNLSQPITYHNERNDENFVIPEFTPTPPAYSDLAMQFILIGNMRRAWIQHVYWMRMLLISIAEKLKDQEDVSARLLLNPTDIANIFGVFYTAEQARIIEDLLSEHLQIGTALITALRDGNTAETESLKNQWNINADQMADMFSSINPYFDLEEVRQMLYNHLDLTTQEIMMRLDGNYAADIDAFDQAEQGALLMADYFSAGIIQQFPNRFS